MALRKRGSIGPLSAARPLTLRFSDVSPREPVEALSRRSKSCGLPCLADRVEFDVPACGSYGRSLESGPGSSLQVMRRIYTRLLAAKD